MPKRKTITKKLRFDVFKRDGFKCAYCGNNPPTVVLEIDHIIPVSRKGTNQIDNLITSCFDCNRGKGAGNLSSVPQSLAEKIEVQKEKSAQIKALDRLLKQQRERELLSIKEIEEAFQEAWPDRQFTAGTRSSVIKFSGLIGLYECVDAMHLACAKTSNPTSAIKYFCGICWRKIRDRKNG
jgi:5-methylcytosine-specific restriction endonuclease McrA